MIIVFLGMNFGSWAVLVEKERISKSWLATAVPQKGADKCIEFAEENIDGDAKIIVKLMRNRA